MPIYVSMLRRLLLSSLVLILFAMLAFSILTPQTAHAATITVNSVADTADPTPNDGVCNVGGGACTLRAAIQTANGTGNPGADAITFDSTVFSSAKTITLGNALPVLAGDTTITGPGANLLTVDGASSFRPFFTGGGTTVTVSGMTIQNAQAAGSGAAFFASGTLLTVDSVYFLNNSLVSGAGGALTVNSGTVVVKNSTFNGNQATGLDGSAIAVAGGNTLILINSTLTANTGRDTLLSTGTSHIINSTIANNTNTVFGSVVGSFITINNSILANNTHGDCTAVPTASISFSVVYDGSCGVAAGVNGNLTALAPGNLSLGALGNHGGPTPTMALGADSFAINAGNNALALDPNGGSPVPIANDQRGAPRVFAGQVDMGAYEAQQPDCPPPPYNVPPGASGLLEYDIACANGTPADDTINLTNSTYLLTMVNDPTDAGNGLPMIASAATSGSLTIHGNGAIITRSAAGGTPQFRIFEIVSGGNLTLDSLTISGGNAATFGGGLDNQGTLTITNSTIAGNTALNDGAIANLGTLVIANSTISGNLATQLAGGIGNTLGHTVTITQSTIANNTASFGGGIYNQIGTLNLGGSIVAANIADPGDSDIDGPVHSNGYNVIGNTAGTTITGTTTGNLTDSAAQPLNLGALGDNGGLTHTMALGAGSVAINAGDPAFVPPPNTDQRGSGFPRVVGSTVDIGAYEAPPLPHLVFAVEPGDTVANATITPAVQVSVEDTSNNVITGDNTTQITLKIGSNPAGGTLSGTLTVTVVSGVATFSDLSIDNIGTGYTLTASAPGLSDVDSDPFDVTLGTAAKLAFVQQPSDTAAGVDIAPPVTVAVEDSTNNVITSDNATQVTLDIGTNPGSSTLGGTVTATVVNGVATFSDLVIDNAGNGYTLTASSNPALTGDTSAAFNITAASCAGFPVTLAAGDTAGLINAVLCANSNGAGTNDVINLTSGTPYTLTQINNTDGGIGGNGLPPIASAAAEGTLTINGNGATIQRDPTASGFRIFYLNTGANLTLDALTVSNGNSSDIGGAIYNAGVLTIDSSTFDSNQADYGGGIYSIGTVTITNSTFSGNAANTFGGGIYNVAGTLTINNSTLSGNWATTWGGGIYNDLTGTLAINSSTLSGNWVTNSSGGGVYNTGNLTVTNSTFSANTAFSWGGGIFDFAGALTVTNSTFSANRADGGGGGIYLTTGTAAVNNSIIANSMGGDCVNSATLTIQHSLIMDGSCGITNGVNGNLVADPLLGALGNNGGTTETMALQAGSPAINAGSNSLAVDPGNGNAPLTTDQIGNPRIVGVVDLGAVEDQGTQMLVFTTEPPSTVANSTTFSVAVSLEDSSGNVLTSDNTTQITLKIGSNPAGGTLSGTLTVTVVNGVATFSDLSIDNIGTGYTLTASAPGLSDVDSDPFDVTLGTATKLAFVQQPSDTTAGVDIAPPVTVAVEDSTNNVITSDNATQVTLDIGTNPGSSTLGGTVTATVVNGVATFSDLIIDNAGNGYTLTASSNPALTGDTSAAFNITAASCAGFPVTLAAGDTAGLINAVLCANSNGAGTNDVINLTSGTPYTLTQINNTDGGDGGNGLPSIASAAAEGTLTINGNGATITRSSTEQFRLLYLNASADLTINSLTLDQGYSSGNGGAIEDRGGTLTVAGSSFNNNQALGNGGGIAAVNGATANITGTTFNTNSAVNNAGGVYSDSGTLTVTDSTITTNTSGNNGGGLLDDGTTTITGSTFSGNKSGRGGGIYSDGTTTIINSTFSGNQGIAPGGGGIFNNGTTTITNSTFSANSGLVFGGNLYNSMGTLTLNNSILANSGKNHDCDNTATIMIQYSLVKDGSCGITNGVNGNLVADPLLGGLGNNGGLTQTMALQAGSPAINAGSNALAVDASSNPLTTDQIGNPRIVGGVVDLGAVEDQGTQKLVFTTEPPSTVTTASTFGLAVSLEDSSGNVLTSDNTTQVTIALNNDPSGGAATFGGTLTATVVNGVATFSGLNINTVGTGYTLKADAPGTTEGGSSAINVIAAITHLAFVQQPKNTAVGAKIKPAVTVEIEDALDAIISSDNTTQITLSIGTNPGGGVLGGTLTATVVNGVATFSNLSIDKIGVGYTLTATSNPPFAGATSNPFNITSGATVAPESTAIPAVFFECQNLAAQTGGAMTSEGGIGAVHSGDETGNVYCHVIAKDGNYVTSSAEIGVGGIINLGVEQAVDVFGELPGGFSVVPFDRPVQICLRGVASLTGEVLFLDAATARRTVERLGTVQQGSYLCVSLTGSGTLVLVSGTSGLAAPPPAPTAAPTLPASTTLNNCRVTTTNAPLNLRAEPSTSGTVLAQLPYNITLTATEYVPGWYNVIYLDGQGWVSATYLSFAGDCGQ